MSPQNVKLILRDKTFPWHLVNFPIDVEVPDTFTFSIQVVTLETATVWQLHHHWKMTVRWIMPWPKPRGQSSLVTGQWSAAACEWRHLHFNRHDRVRSVKDNCCTDVNQFRHALRHSDTARRTIGRAYHTKTLTVCSTQQQILLHDYSPCGTISTIQIIH